MKTKWIQIDLQSDMKDRRGSPAYSKQRINKIENWLAEQFISGAIDKWIIINYHVIGLSCEEDAMAVKLRWS